jgi:hypothetical protein
MPTAAKLWHVYLVPECQYTKPPKSKYVVVVYVDTDAWGFLVNSNIIDFIRSQPDLLVCEAEIYLKGHSRWLKYDSYVDCRLIFPFSDAELKYDQGLVTTEARQNILKAIDLCEALEEKFRLAILQRELGIDTPPTADP